MIERQSFGLTKTELAEIVSVISVRPEVEKAVVFGSRALNKNREGSDIDIALKGETVEHQTVVEVSRELNEETNLPYQFDILSFKEISNPSFVDHIRRVGKTIYERKADLTMEYTD